MDACFANDPDDSPSLIIGLEVVFISATGIHFDLGGETGACGEHFLVALGRSLDTTPSFNRSNTIKAARTAHPTAGASAFACDRRRHRRPRRRRHPV